MNGGPVNPGFFMSETQKAIDWEAIELDYRLGIKTLRQIAEEHEITHGAINKRAKKLGWERDLSAMKQLSKSLKIVIGLEREALVVDYRHTLGETLESLLEKIDG